MPPFSWCNARERRPSPAPATPVDTAWRATGNSLETARVNVSVRPCRLLSHLSQLSPASLFAESPPHAGCWGTLDASVTTPPRPPDVALRRSALPAASPASMPPTSSCQQPFTCCGAPFSPTPGEHSVPAAHARLASWPRRRCAWATAGERARWGCQPAAARGYRPPWPSGDGRGARRRVCTSRPSSNRFASVGGSTQISVSRLTRSAARARI